MPKTPPITIPTADLFPRGVVIHMTDGRQIPAEVAYSHTDDDEISHFFITMALDLHLASHINVEVLPEPDYDGDEHEDRIVRRARSARA